MTNHILAIGINKYQNVTPLNNCVKDLDNMLDILTDKYDFTRSNITKLFDSDATNQNIIFSLEDYFTKQNSGANLLILFSGHGDFDTKLDLGYFLPYESILDNKATYTPNTTIFNYVKAYEYRHVVLISDTCFSGSLFAQYKSLPSPNERLYEIPSKWALTSGRIEKVSDGVAGTNSPFADSIITTLKNSSDDLSISDLTKYVVSDVARVNSQIPRGAPLQMLGDKGGEFLFKLRAKTKSVKSSTSLDSEKNEIETLFAEYYSNSEKLEDAENQNKMATLRRLTEEIQFIGNIINRELVKILEFEKTKMFTSKKLQKILGENISVKYEGLQDIAKQKNLAVKVQHFDIAADLRDKEKEQQEKFLSLIREKEEEIAKNLVTTEDSIKEDFALLSILSDITPARYRGSARRLIDESFKAILFLKIARDLSHISNFRFQNKFEEFKNKLIPELLKMIFNPGDKTEDMEKINNFFDKFTLSKIITM